MAENNNNSKYNNELSDNEQQYSKESDDVKNNKKRKFKNKKTNGSQFQRTTTRGKAYTTKNYSFKNISSKVENSNTVFGRSFDEIDETIVINSKIKLLFHRLKQQANVFAKSIIAETFDKRYVFGTRDDNWLLRAERIYVYSFFRSICYGAFSFLPDDIDSNYFVFAGHAVLAENLRARRFSSLTEKGNMIQHTLSIDFNFSDEIANIIREFPWLTNCIEERSDDKYYVSNTMCDNWLSRLSDQGLKSISLVELRSDSSNIRKFITSNNTPIGNSGFSYDNTNVNGNNTSTKSRPKFLFIDSGEDIAYNQSIWLPIATFCHIGERNTAYTQSYYEEFDRYEKDYRLVKYEVHAVTFLRTSVLPDSKYINAAPVK